MLVKYIIHVLKATFLINLLTMCQFFLLSSLFKFLSFFQLNSHLYNILRTALLRGKF